MIKLLIGGSPCAFWSIAKKNSRETEAEGAGWELFKNFLIARDKFNPDLFLYENNKSVAQPIKDQISQELGVDLMYINSALVSAQNRQRFYVFNWEVRQPEDRCISLQSILEFGEARREKSKTIRVGGSDSGWGDKHEWDMPNENRVYTTTELERLQTIPDGYTKGISEVQRRKCIGNGWTAEVIIHILQGALAGKPRDEEIVVLSMYDGIGTGRYCLDKMGFTNVTYYAYEIDEPAKKVALSNYADIIQLGDAFDLRKNDWQLPLRPQSRIAAKPMSAPAPNSAPALQLPAASDEIFTIKARRCKRCGGILTSKQAVEDGYGHVCKMKTLQEEDAKRPIDGQMTLLDLGGEE